ncbi:hypothetical protein J6590_023517 [Homalodisca vitripennis]|nr:hypothetical protein J6590_023517 [Homalodisca vitripennis]
MFTGVLLLSREEVSDTGHNCGGFLVSYPRLSVSGRYLKGSQDVHQGVLLLSREEVSDTTSFSYHEEDGTSRAARMFTKAVLLLSREEVSDTGHITADGTSRAARMFTKVVLLSREEVNDMPRSFFTRTNFTVAVIHRIQ